MVLRDGSSCHGRVALSDGQSLAAHLGSRKGGWVNLQNVVWTGDGEASPHMVLQVDHLALAASTDHDTRPAPASATTARWVQVVIENGVRLQGCVYLDERQRLSDFLHEIGKFLPLVNATRVADQDALGDVAINSAAIKVVRDMTVPAVSEWSAPDVESSDYSIFLVDTLPVTHEAISAHEAVMRLLTPGRMPDRRAGETRPRALERAPRRALAALELLEAELVPLTLEQQCGLGRASRHWLGQLAERRGMAPAVGRMLSAWPTTSELWASICAANDMVEEELAVLVGEHCQVPVVVFEEIEARAVAQIPGRIARRLHALPVSCDDEVLRVATADPLDTKLVQQLRFATRLRIEVVAAPPTALEHALEWWYPEDHERGQ